MIEIIPSILSADFARLAVEIDRVEKGGAKMLHVDVMDGHFVPNITIGPPVVESIRKATHLHLDCHLMIEDPDRYAAAFVDAGANSVSVHFEACRHLDGTLETIRGKGALAGVVRPGGGRRSRCRQAGMAMRRRRAAPWVGLLTIAHGAALHRNSGVVATRQVRMVLIARDQQHGAIISVRERSGGHNLAQVGVSPQPPSDEN